MIVYKATNILDGKSYIGQTGLSLNERKAEHIRKAKKNSPVLFWSAIEQFGSESFRWEVIDISHSREELEKSEIRMIEFYDTFNNGYNMTKGGRGMLGTNHSKETKNKIGNRAKGNKRCVGREVGQETRNKIGEANKGRLAGEKNPKAKITEEDVIKIRNMHQTGNYLLKELALSFNVSLSLISQIVRREIWTHIEEVV